jgi:hypothetical protein
MTDSSAVRVAKAQPAASPAKATARWLHTFKTAPAAILSGALDMLLARMAYKSHLSTGVSCPILRSKWRQACCMTLCCSITDTFDAADGKVYFSRRPPSTHCQPSSPLIESPSTERRIDQSPLAIYVIWRHVPHVNCR